MSPGEYLQFSEFQAPRAKMRNTSCGPCFVFCTKYVYIYMGSCQIGSRTSGAGNSTRAGTAWAGTGPVRPGPAQGRYFSTGRYRAGRASVQGRYGASCGRAAHRPVGTRAHSEGMLPCTRDARFFRTSLPMHAKAPLMIWRPKAMLPYTRDDIFFKTSLLVRAKAPLMNFRLLHQNDALVHAKHHVFKTSLLVRAKPHL